ncbi:START domain [Sesbania bispinosa]|nr:START domain [Sesbania bispinosa]
MSDEGMRDGEMGVDHHDLIYKNNGTSQDNNGSGNPTLSSEHSGDANVTSSYSYSPRLLMNLGGVNMPRASDLLFGVSIFAEATKAKIIDLAHSAFDELLRIGVVGKPLWHSQVDYRFEILNDIEYLRQFGQVDTTLREIMKLVEVNDPQTLPSFNSFGTQYQTSEPAHEAALQIEASRETAFVNMSPISLVELLMDVREWKEVVMGNCTWHTRKQRNRDDGDWAVHGGVRTGRGDLVWCGAKAQFLAGVLGAISSRFLSIKQNGGDHGCGFELLRYIVASMTSSGGGGEVGVLLREDKRRRTKEG